MTRKLQFLEYLTLKASFEWFKDQIQKVKYDVIGSKRSTDKSEKLVNHRQLFCWIFTHWERKQLILSPVLDQCIKTTQGSRSAHLNGYILKAFTRLEDDEEVVRLLNTLCSPRSFSSSSFSTFWITRKLLIVIFELKNLLFCFVLAKILLLKVLRSHYTLYLFVYTLLRDLVSVSNTNLKNLFIITWPTSGLCEFGEVRIKYYSL